MYKKSFIILIEIIIIIAIIESLVMLSFIFFGEGLSPLSEIIIDTFLLSILSAPLLYQYVIRTFIEKEANSRKELEKLNETFTTNVIASHTDLYGTITYASEALCEISGYIQVELIGKPHSILRHPDTPKSTFKDMWKTIQSGNTWCGEFKNSTKDGGYYWVSASILPQFDSENILIGYDSVSHDITDSNESKNKLIEQKEILDYQNQLLHDILNTTKNPMVLTNLVDIQMSNDAFNNLLDLEYINIFNQSVNHNFSNIFVSVEGYLHNGLLKENEIFLSLVLRTPPENRIVSIINKDHEPKAFSINIVKVKDNEDYLVTLSDITEMKEQHVLTSKKAYIDSLTNVYNRNKFDEILEIELKNVQRYKNPMSIALIDIDNFKNFNDTHGHLIGDEVLSKMAQIVNDGVRETDTFARWGGEEFVVLFRNTPADIAKQVSEKLKGMIEENEHPIAGKITASFGVSEYKEGDTHRSIFKRCDDALYRAKANGRNRVEVL